MFKLKYKICEAFGIPVYTEISFLLILFLFATSFGSFAYGIACGLVLAISIVLHELGHALTARAFGYKTRDITISFLGGCASLSSMPRKAYQEFLTAAAGPLVSFMLAGLSFFVLFLFGGMNAVQGIVVKGFDEFFHTVFYYSMWTNFILGCFNLLPGFPMDGGRIFRCIARIFTTRVKATYIAMIVGRATAVLIGLRGLHAMFSGGSFGFISIFIAWMIWNEGKREYLQTMAEDSWGGRWEYSGRVSPPPYGGDEEEVEIKKN